MLHNYIIFEYQYWRKRWITYIMPLITFLSALAIFTAEGVTIGGTDVLYRNCPNNINMLYIVFSTLLPLFLNSFIGSAITRDYEYKFDQILFSTPISRLEMMIGRFIGCFWVISLIFISILVADMIARYMPWADKELLGPVRYDAHAQSFFVLALPNIFIIGSFLLLISAWTKNITKSFLAALVLFISYQIIMSLNDEIDNKTIGCLMDPYGFIPIYYVTKKWSAFEKNNLLFPIEWRYLANRLIWISVALGLWTAAYFSHKISFNFLPKAKEAKEDKYLQNNSIHTRLDFSFAHTLRSVFYQAWIEFKYIVRTPVFYILVGMILIMQLTHIIEGMMNDELSNMATSYNVVREMNSVSTIVVLVLTFITGILFWKERDAKMQDIYDAIPTKTGTYFLGKIIAVLGVNLSISFVLAIYAILYQIAHNYLIFDFSVYFIWLFVRPMFEAFCIVTLAAFFQVLFNNKYLGFFAVCVVIIGEGFLLQWLKIESNMVGITSRLPRVIYSDFYGFGPYLKPYLLFAVYWILVYSLLAFLTYLFYRRGHLDQMQERWKEAWARLKNAKFVGLSILLTTAAFSTFLFWQTQKVNTYFSTDESNQRSADYEKKFKRLENEPNLKVYDADFNMDIEPHQRAYSVHGRLKLTNNEDEPVTKIYINNSLKYPFIINIHNAALISSDSSTVVNFQTYELNAPIYKGDTIEMDYVYTEAHRGIANETENQRLMPNGSFLDFSEFTPFLGYNKNLEIGDKSDRDKYSLPVKAEEFPKLERNCTKNCMVDELGIPALWTNMHTIVSTADDQIAIAPGSLIKKWSKKGKNYFEYQLDQPSPFFFSIVSGNYELKLDSAAGVQCEVYYLKNHYHNVNEMMKALKRSISYYSTNYGPYRHKQARIIEFPQFSGFAQAFPGTMPYSESIGFTSDLVENPKDINQIFHVVAHEMAHQWWAHQVTGAYMQGCTLLSESLAEYSSLNLLEIEYGKDMMAKFLKQSNNGYIFGRAMESKKESSLLEQDGQAYIRYQKGSIVLYGIQQLLGIEKMNMILNNLVKNYAYKEPPYPTSHVLVDAIYANTPDSFKETFKDGLERIIVFQADIKEAKVKQLADKSFETSITFSLTKNSADPNAKQTKNVKDIAIGNSKEAPIQDYFDIGLYTKTEDKSRYGKLIQMQRVKLNKKENAIKLLSKIRPDKMVIDPYFIHIHKDPEDNIEKL